MKTVLYDRLDEDASTLSWVIVLSNSKLYLQSHSSDLIGLPVLLMSEGKGGGSVHVRSMSVKWRKIRNIGLINMENSW